jgi:hypothetical protein
MGSKGDCQAEPAALTSKVQREWGKKSSIRS